MHPTPTRCSTPHAQRPAQRGSAIILVVISIILLALLGATYLQITRFERLAEPEQGNIETVLQSIITKAATVMAEDIVKDGRNAFDSRDIATEPLAGIKPYDYDYLRPLPNAPTPLPPGSTVTIPATETGGTFAPEALLEDLDDPWLASSYLTGGRFRNITNLMGYFMDTDIGGNPENISFDSRDQQFDFLPQRVTAPNPPPADTTEFADTDDDGFSDARWAWPPIFEINGIQYTFAIRIVDLSARLNANVALMGTNEDGDRLGHIPETAPRGTTPAELSFGGFATDGFGLNATDMNQIVDTNFTTRQSLMDYRFGGVVPPGPALDYNTGPRFYESLVGPRPYDRLDHWLNGSFRMGAAGTWNNGDTIPYQGFPLSDTFDLLARNGLNDGEDSTLENPAGIAQVALLRSDQDESGIIADGFAGGLNGFFTGDARKWLTTHSGIGTVSPPLAAGDALNRLRNPFAATGQEVTDALTGLGYTPGSGMAAGDFEDYLALSIRDAADEDNQPTVHNGKAGFEPLPMLTEVHLQIPYRVTSLTAGGSGTGIELTREDPGYAIEIGNPFRVPISLQNITLRVNGIDWFTLDTLVTGKNLLEVDELIVIHRNSASGPFADPYNDIASRIRNAARNTFGTAGTVTQVASTQAWPTATSNVVVELVVTSDDGATAVTYSRINTLNTVNADPTKTFDPWPGPSAAPGVANEVRFLVENNQGNANLLNMLHTSAADIDSEEDATDVAATTVPPGNAEAFGDANKINIGAVEDLPALTGEQYGLLQKDRLDYLGDLALIPGLGVDVTGDRPIAEVWGAGVSMADHRLPLPGTAGPGGPEDAFRVDYLSLAMARLSTISPLMDGLDNNGVGGVDDAAENFTPGTMNLNTMPEFLISAVLPIPNLAERDDVAERIVRYRDIVNAGGGASTVAAERTASGAALTRQNQGIAYIGELFAPLTGLVALHPNGINFSDGATPPQPLIVLPLDWNTGFFGDDGITGDVDEQILFQKWLPQMFSTRSDVFAAYILINGYAGAPFNHNSLRETLRAIVIFQRANVQQAGDTATVLEVIRF